ncbi:MAG: hypothetical protein ABUK01_05645 [Leptospirales bacterium]
MKKTIIMMFSIVLLLNACGEKEASGKHAKHGEKKVEGCEITHLIAEFNAKEQPATLTVMGNVMVHTKAATVEFKEAVAQGTNDTILLMSLKIVEADEPMEHDKKHIHYVKTDGELKKYKKVQIQGYDHCIVDVKDVD